MVNMAYVSERSAEYTEFWESQKDQPTLEDPQNWVFDAAEGCSEYAIV